MEYVAGPAAERADCSTGLRNAARLLRIAIAVSDALGAGPTLAGIVHRDQAATSSSSADGVPQGPRLRIAKLVDPPARGRHDEITTEPPATAPAAGRRAASAARPGYVAPELVTGCQGGRAQRHLQLRLDALRDADRPARLPAAPTAAETIGEGTGTREAKPPREIVPDLSRVLEQVRCCAACARTPERRFQSDRRCPGRAPGHRRPRRVGPRQLAGRSASPAVPWLLRAGLAAGVATRSASRSVRLGSPRSASRSREPRLEPYHGTRGIEATSDVLAGRTAVRVRRRQRRRRPDGQPELRPVGYAWWAAPRRARIASDQAPTMPSPRSWSPDGPLDRHLRGRRRTNRGPRRLPAWAEASRPLVANPGGAGSETNWLRGAPASQMPGRRTAATSPSPAGGPANAGGTSGIEILCCSTAVTPSPPDSPPAAAMVHRDPAFSPDGGSSPTPSATNTHQPPPCDVHVLDLDAGLCPRPPARRSDADHSTSSSASPGHATAVALARRLHASIARTCGGSPPTARRSPSRIEIGLAAACRRGDRGQRRPARVTLQTVNDRRRLRVRAGQAGRRGGVVDMTTTVPTFAPDGRRFAFESGPRRRGERDSGLAAPTDRTGPADTRARRVAGLAGVVAGRLAYRLRFARRGRLLGRLGDRTGRPRPAAAGRGPLGRRDADLVAGRTLDFYYRQDRADGFDLWRGDGHRGDGEAERVTTGGGFRGVESPDGRLVRVRAQGRTESPLFAQPVGGGPARTLVECAITRTVTAGPDGIYYLGCPAEVPRSPVYRVDPETGAARLLGTAGDQRRVRAGGWRSRRTGAASCFSRLGRGRIPRPDAGRGLSMRDTAMTPAPAPAPPVVVYDGREWPLPDGEHVIGRGDDAAIQHRRQRPVAPPRAHRRPPGARHHRGPREQERHLLRRRGSDRAARAPRRRRDPSRPAGAARLPSAGARRHRDRDAGRHRWGARGAGRVPERRRAVGRRRSRARRRASSRSRVSPTWRARRRSPGGRGPLPGAGRSPGRGVARGRRARRPRPPRVSARVPWSCSGRSTTRTRRTILDRRSGRARSSISSSTRSPAPSAWAVARAASAAPPNARDPP